jgi:superfamily II DNA or RNA helicase
MAATRILTTKGYSIPKSELTEAQTKAMQAELTVAPKMNTKFATKAMMDAAKFKLFRESPTRWYLPRSWAINAYGAPQENVVPEGSCLRPELVFQGKPYDYQVAIMDSFMNAGANGLICVPCGKGKTFMALGIAARIGKRFLVVVDKEFLMNQWRGEMEALLPGIRVGIVQGPKREIDPAKYDCSICMIQTICGQGQDIPDGLFSDYGFTIFDECHHLGAQHFSKTLQRIQTRSMLGLSATPTREDGMSKVFTWFLGEPVYWEKTREPDPTVEVKGVFVETNDETYNTVPTDWRGEVVMARMLGNVLGCDERNREILRWILRLCEEPSRRVLVLSERIGHLERIEQLIKEANATLTTAYYVGGMKEAVREEGAASARILLASYAMASEAMNIKTLNAVILASPRKSVEQSTGRILRVRPDQRKVPPVIVDIVDEHSMYQSQWRKRLTYYRKCAYQVEKWQMGATTGDILATRAKKVAAEPEGGCLIVD